MTEQDRTDVTTTAVSIVERAEALAREHVAAAEEQAATILEQAQEEASLIVSGARDEIGEASERIRKLQEIEASYRSALQELIFTTQERIQAVEVEAPELSEDETEPAAEDAPVEGEALAEPAAK